jgi:hypothetical protein
MAADDDDGGFEGSDGGASKGGGMATSRLFVEQQDVQPSRGGGALGGARPGGFGSGRIRMVTTGAMSLELETGMGAVATAARPGGEGKKEKSKVGLYRLNAVDP